MAESNENTVTSYDYKALCGRWTTENKLGVVITLYRVKTDFDTNHDYLKADDNPKKINFLRYIAWLAEPLHRKKPMDADASYEERKNREYQRQKAMSTSGRDIGDIPEVKNPDVKEQCRENFRLFCETYFPNTFSLSWSSDHLKAIERIEECVLRGGLFALAMPRGSGKSSLCEVAGIWSQLYGHREFLVLIGATEGAAIEMMDSIKTELETNELLMDDFPEVCFPIRQLDGIANRCAGQLYHGERTRITWTSNEIVLPTIAGSAASGMIIRVAGITGRVRGMKYKRSDGESVRPSLVIVDDPQTTESAGSVEQTRKRVRILVSDVLGLAGPGKKIAGLMPCTIIHVGDMADQILDRSKHPEWSGEKTKMVYAFPTNMTLWEKYSEIRAESLRENGDLSAATAFYKKHRKEMDEGAVVSWDARYNYDELSAIQHAMNLKFTDEMAFQAEYQNEPMPDDIQEDNLLSVDEICRKLNGLQRGIVPLNCVRLTMFVDIQKPLLFYCICAWADDFTGAVVDYGAWPDQHRIRFSLADANPTMQTKFPNSGIEGQIYAALDALFKEQMSREFKREDGAMMHIEQAMIDANWGQSTDVVYQFCRQSGYSNILYPGHGRYVGASSKPMTEYKRKPGERLGFNWFMPAIAGKRAIRHVIFDTNFWKSFVHGRLSVAMGDPGCLSLFGKNPMFHQLFAEHLTAEYRVKTQGLGRVVDEWKLRASHEDNHWLDCLAGCAVCASMRGSALAEQMNGIVRKEKRVLSSGSAAPIASADSPSVPSVSVRQPMKLSDIQKARNV